MEGSWIGRRFGLFQDLWPRKTPQKQTPSALCQSWSLFFLESFFSFLGIGSYNCKMVQTFSVSWLKFIQNHGRHQPKKKTQRFQHEKRPQLWTSSPVQSQGVSIWIHATKNWSTNLCSQKKMKNDLSLLASFIVESFGSWRCYKRATRLAVMTKQ